MVESACLLSRAVSSRVLVPAFRLDQRRYALALPVPVRSPTVAEREPIDVDEPVVIAELDDAAEHRDGAIPVLHVEHRDGYSRVASHVGQPQPLEVHVDEQAAVVPVVPGRGRIWSAVRADGGNDGRVRPLQELDELGWKRCRWQGTSVRSGRPVPDVGDESSLEGDPDLRWAIRYLSPVAGEKIDSLKSPPLGAEAAANAGCAVPPDQEVEM
jgi:hypothetical protein